MFSKNTGYAIEPGKFARLKCVEKHDRKWDLVIKILIKSIDLKQKETFNLNFIRPHSNANLHSKRLFEFLN